MSEPTVQPPQRTKPPLAGTSVNTRGSLAGRPAGTAGSLADPSVGSELPTVELRRRSPYDSKPTTVIPRPTEPVTEGVPVPYSPADAETTPWHRPGTAPLVIPPGLRRRWPKVIKRTLTKAWDDSLFGMSAEAAFWQALSTAPLLLALLGSIGYVSSWFGPATIDTVEQQTITLLQTIFSDEVTADLIAPTVHTVLREGQADLVSVGFVIALWAGSSAVASFVESITIAYGQHEVRHPVAERFFALGLYLGALVVGIFALPLLAVGPDYLPNFFPDAWHDNVRRIVSIAYYPGLGLLLVVALATLYKVAPRHRHPWKRGLPGAVVAATVFIISSSLLRTYLSYVTTHGLTYGALATPIAFMLFAFMVGIAVILGAQFNNATLEYYPPRRSRRERQKWQRLDAEPPTGPMERLPKG
jgi:membrane protein